MNSLKDSLRALGHTLPEPTPTAYAYAPLSVHNGIAYLAGQIPKTGPTSIRAAGKVGAEVPVEEARDDAGLCVLHGLSWLAHHLGDLDAVARPLQLTVYVAAAPGCDRISDVADGASLLLHGLFGPDVGAHPRSVIGVDRLPRNAPVMIDAVFALA